jgi:hypothetical protein
MGRLLKPLPGPPQRRLYRLKPEPLQEVAAWLAPFRRFWSAHVDALERHLDRMDQSTPTKGKTKEKTMNVLLWVLQVALALLYLSGGRIQSVQV